MGARSAARFGIGVLDGVAAAMLLFALYGHPPYAFFGMMKLVVLVACALSAWYAFVRSPALIVVSVLAAVCAYVEVTGKYRRAEWALPNWVAVVVLACSAVVCFWPLSRCGSPSSGDSGGGG